MAREFKPVRFFVMMALAAFVVCGVTAFYTHRAAHGRTAEESQEKWDLAFENGYTDGFNKTHCRQ